VKRILGLLGWLGFGLVVVAVLLRFTRPELADWYRGLAMAGLVVTLLYALTQWRDIARHFQRRNVRYGSLAAGSIILVLGILVALNWIANRQNVRWDLTAGRQFSVSAQTRLILETLDAPVSIRVFYQSGTEQGLRDQLEQYEYLSDQVSVEFIDPDREPTRARQDDVQQYGTVVVEYNGRLERTTLIDEQHITNALKKVIEGQAKKIYFVQGHGERDPLMTDASGYTGIADALRNDNFEIETVTLLETGAVPADASVLIVAGPKTDLFPPEIEAISSFLDAEGKVMLLIDPPDQAGDPEPTSLIELARAWGIDVGNDIVVDASGVGQLIGTDASAPIGAPVNHAITAQFQNMITAFPFARSVVPIDGGVDGRFAQAVIETSPQSWSESDIAGLYATGEVERNFDAGDIPGPITLAAAVSVVSETPEPTGDPTTDPAVDPVPPGEARLLVVGDSDFASNSALGIPGNRDLYLNMANWLALQENLIAIRPRDPEDRRITLTADQNTRIGWISLVGIPLLLFGNAVRVWWKRR
jgi:ABC-type uncharacterized transport system involved in gliding motility auxiliary subunit